MAERNQELIDIGLELLGVPKDNAVDAFLKDKRYEKFTKDVKSDNKEQVLNAIKQATGESSTAENEAFDLSALITSGGTLKPHQVRKLQGFLALRGDNEIELDGVAGDKTKTAAKTFFESTADKRKKDPKSEAEKKQPFDLVKYKIPGNPYDGTDGSGPEYIGFVGRLFGGEQREKERLKDIVAKPDDLAYQYVYTFMIPHEIKGDGKDLLGLDSVPPKDRPQYVAAHRAEFEAANPGVTLPSSNDWHDYLSVKEKRITDLITRYESIQVDPNEVNEFQQNQIAEYREDRKQHRLSQYQNELNKLDEKMIADNPQKKEIREKIKNIDEEMKNVGQEQSTQVGGLMSPWIHGSMASPANVVDQHLRRQRGGDAILQELNAELHSIGQRDYGMIREVLTLQAKRRIWQAEEVVKLEANAKAEAANKPQQVAETPATTTQSAATPVVLYKTLPLSEGIAALDKIGTKDAPEGATIADALKHMKLWSMTDDELKTIEKPVADAAARLRDGIDPSVGKDIVKEARDKQMRLAERVWFSADKANLTGENGMAKLESAKSIADIDKALAVMPLWGMDSKDLKIVTEKAAELHRGIDSNFGSGLYEEKIAKLRKEQIGLISDVLYTENPSAPQAAAPQATVDKAADKTTDSSVAPQSAKPVDPYIEKIDQVSTKQQELANQMVVAIRDNSLQLMIISRIAAKNPELAKEIRYAIDEKIEPNLSPLRRMTQQDITDTIAELNSYPEGMGLKKIADPLAAFTELEQQRLGIVAEQQAANTVVEPSPNTTQPDFKEAANQQKETGLSAEQKKAATNQVDKIPENVANAFTPDKNKPNAQPTPTNNGQTLTYNS